mmetsp:Transcript_49886/g.120127  ORF Transcript_49886/g.120127 Transcript_49886/m.120127 type:complete len:201 (+) Transcript_49886:268-870(+)
MGEKCRTRAGSSWETASRAPTSSRAKLRRQQPPCEAASGDTCQQTEHVPQAGQEADKPTAPSCPSPADRPRTPVPRRGAARRRSRVQAANRKAPSPAKTAFEEQEDPIPRAPTAFEEHVDEHLYKRGQTPAMLRLRRTRSEYTVPKPPAKKSTCSKIPRRRSHPPWLPPRSLDQVDWTMGPFGCIGARAILEEPLGKWIA